jgi:hypothetical protein
LRGERSSGLVKHRWPYEIKQLGTQIDGKFNDISSVDENK